MAETHATPAHAATRTSLLDVRHISKVFGTRGSRGVTTTALSDLSFTVGAGEFVGIMGPSGSGKTTLLNCISTIDVPTSGSILLDGQDVTTLRGRQLARFRREQLGFVFQDANLVETLTGFENIALSLTIKGERPALVIPLVRGMAKRLGVSNVLDKYPNQMSGGQRQRTAAARAFVGNPKLVLADEPTGALDSRNANVMLETLEHANRMDKTTIMMVTHDAYAASFTSRVLFIKDGALFDEVTRGDLSREEFFDRIIEVVTFLGGGARHAG